MPIATHLMQLSYGTEINYASTGYKRPTIANMSWGYGRNPSNINGGNYRGTDWTGTSKRTKLSEW